jgi:hypothetical protein
MYRIHLQHGNFEIGRRFDIQEFHIIGSAAILAALPNPPDGALTATRDVDVIPPNDGSSPSLRAATRRLPPDSDHPCQPQKPERSFSRCEARAQRATIPLTRTFAGGLTHACQ